MLTFIFFNVIFDMEEISHGFHNDYFKGVKGIMEAAVERRRFTRVKFKTALQYHIRGRGDYRHTLTEDIGEGGVKFSDTVFLAPQTHLMLKFNTLDKILQPIARIAWVSHIPHTDRYLYGAEFVETDPETQKSLKNFIELRSQL